MEGAISKGNHAEAAKLAHELADFRVSCSVTKNNKSTSTYTYAGSSTNQVHSPSSSHEIKQLAPIHSDIESSRMQASSNISECYYDAAEVMDDEKLSIIDHENLLNLEELVPQKETSDPQTTSMLSCTNSSETLTSFSVLPQANQISKTDSSHESFNGTDPQRIDKTTEMSSNIQETHKISNSPSAVRREIRVDPARREVKSDTITKLPEGLHVHMKENKESNQPF